MPNSTAGRADMEVGIQRGAQDGVRAGTVGLREPDETLAQGETSPSGEIGTCRFASAVEVIAQVCLLVACMTIVSVVCVAILLGRADAWVGALLPVSLGYMAWLTGGSRRDGWMARVAQAMLVRR